MAGNRGRSLHRRRRSKTSRSMSCRFAFCQRARKRGRGCASGPVPAAPGTRLHDGSAAGPTTLSSDPTWLLVAFASVTVEPRCFILSKVELTQIACRGREAGEELGPEMTHARGLGRGRVSDRKRIGVAAPSAGRTLPTSTAQPLLRIRTGLRRPDGENYP